MNMATRPAAPSDRTNNRTPNRFEIDQAADELIRNYGAVIMSDARKYSACKADAEDAYQRALEILVTKAPTTDPKHLVPWIRTVVRREAVAIMKSRHRQGTISLEQGGELFEEIASLDITPEEYAELSDELAAGTEALARLSADQVSCLLAQAEGFTYDEISASTGFSARKVTRCVYEGRKAFLRRVDAIESGTECERVDALLQRLVDGDSDSAIEARPHLANCSACRTRLHTYRSAPSSVAALFPPAIVLTHQPPVSFFAALNESLDRAADWVAFKLFRAQQWSEVGALQKSGMAAALATTAIVGGVAIDRHAGKDFVSSSISPVASVQGTEISRESGVEKRFSASSSARSAARKQRRKSTATLDLAPPASATSPNNNLEQAPAAAPDAPQVDDGSSEFLPEAR